MTGWLVAVIGFKLKIEAFALPMLGIGMVLRLTGETTLPERASVIAPEATDSLAAFRLEAVHLLTLADTTCEEFDGAACDAAFAAFEHLYQSVKSDLLRAGAAGAIEVTRMETLLRVISLSRRAVEQAVKAVRRLRELGATAPLDGEQQDQRAEKEKQ